MNLEDLQMKIFLSMKEQALSLEGEVSEELKEYQKAQLRFNNREFETSTLDELTTKAVASQLVYLGDFHTFDQSSRNMRRLISKITEENKKTAIGVEFIHSRHQNIVDAFLKNLITELEFLEGIDYHDSWRFPWIHYRQFFESAKEKNLPVLALNSEGTLEQRDLTAAKSICDFLKKNNDTTLLVLFGELHIVPDKLPQRVLDINSSISHVIIHQNLDDIYWKLKEQKNLSEEGLAKFSEQEYCLITSAPWVKYESMIYWFENFCDDPEFDIHDYLMETGMMAFNDNVPENFMYLTNEIGKALNIRLDEDELENFNIYDHQRLDIVEEKINSLERSEIQDYFHFLIYQGKSFKCPYSQSYYCSSYSINRISFLAGLHTYSLILSTKDPEYENILNEKNSSRWIYLTYQMLVAYLSSKIINPHRKCDLYQDIEEKSKQDSSHKIVLDILNRNFENLDPNISLKEVYYPSRVLGFYLAERLYEDYFVKLDTKYNDILSPIINGDFNLEKFREILELLIPINEMSSQKKRFF